MLVSGAGSNLAALLAAHDDVTYGARVVGVVSDNPAAGALTSRGPRACPPSSSRRRTSRTGPAGTGAWPRPSRCSDPSSWSAPASCASSAPRFLARFPARVLNTHPALLPAFPGAHAVRDALAHGVKVTGCTVHVVDAGVDTGPIVAQAAVAVEPDDDEASLHERIKVAERALLVDWVGRIAREGLTHRRPARVGGSG